MSGEGGMEVCEAKDIQMGYLGYGINIKRSMKRSWYGTEAHLKSQDPVCTVSWLSQESA